MPHVDGQCLFTKNLVRPGCFSYFSDSTAAANWARVVKW